MKKLFLSIILLFSATLMFAQAPDAFNYQAVARNTSGGVIPNQPIALRLTIHDATSGGSVLYQERQTATTNQFGLFSVQIGNGSLISGDITVIDWAGSLKFLQVEFDPTGGSSYIDMGTTQLISVPYAKTANTINMFASGTANPDKMIIIHSPAYPTWGLQYQDAPDKFNFLSSGNTVLDVDLGNQRVGIGTNSPSYPLHVISSVNTGVEVDGTDSSYAGFFANATVSTAKPFYGYMVGGAQQAYTETDNAGDWYLINNGFSNSLAIAAMASGKVGIGTASPSGQLSVINNGSGLGYPSIYTSNTNAAGIGIYVTTNSTDATAVFTNATGSTGNAAIMAKFFDGGASDLVRIDNNDGQNEGRISLWGENTGNNYGGYLNGINFNNGGGFVAGAIVSGNYRELLAAYNTTPTTSVFTPGYDNATSCGSASYRWTAVYAVNGTIQTSDERSKENVQPISYGLDALMSLKPVSYQWKDAQARIGSGNNLGFLAQDLEKVLPDVVVHTQVTQEEIDNAKKIRGKDITNTDTYGVKYSEIIPVLVKAIQEQQAEIEALKDQINSQQKK